MSLDMVLAVIDGYSDRLLDQQILAVQAGYWAAYYVGSKHPKPVRTLTEEMVSKHTEKKKGARKAEVQRPEVDVDAFLAQEERFKARLASQGQVIM